MGAVPLPEGNNAAETVRRLRAIDAEFFGSILVGGSYKGGDIYSSTWDGAVPASLSAADDDATAGYYFDSSTGSVQFSGNVWLPSASSQVVVGATDGARVSVSDSGILFLDVFDSPLETPSVALPFITTSIDGDIFGSYPADSDMIWTFRMAEWTSNDPPWIRMRSHNYDPGSIQWGIGSYSDGYMFLNQTRLSIDTTFLKLPVKSTTGDPSSPQDGDMYVNTSDNKVRVYADAAWRDLATW